MGSGPEGPLKSSLSFLHGLLPRINGLAMESKKIAGSPSALGAVRPTTEQLIIAISRVRRENNGPALDQGVSRQWPRTSAKRRTRNNGSAIPQGRALGLPGQASSSSDTYLDDFTEPTIDRTHPGNYTLVAVAFLERHTRLILRKRSLQRTLAQRSGDLERGRKRGGGNCR